VRGDGERERGKERWGGRRENAATITASEMIY